MGNGPSSNGGAIAELRGVTQTFVDDSGRASDWRRVTERGLPRPRFVNDVEGL